MSKHMGIEIANNGFVLRSEKDFSKISHSLHSLILDIVEEVHKARGVVPNYEELATMAQNLETEFERRSGTK